MARVCLASTGPGSAESSSWKNSEMQILTPQIQFHKTINLYFTLLYQNNQNNTIKAIINVFRTEMSLKQAWELQTLYQVLIKT